MKNSKKNNNKFIFDFNKRSNDPFVENLIKEEEKRQKKTINLIASENYVPKIILKALGSVLTNKYAEGYPGNRYYSGCEIIDEIESCAIERCKKLFSAEHANVQPHSGAQANMALYASLLKPGDTIMGMSLASGGHLTHGHKVNFSGVFYNSIQYNVNPKTELLNYDEIYDLAKKHKPKLIMAGSSAYSRIIDFAKFKEISESIGAFFAVDMSHFAGLVAAKLYPSPVPYADIVSSTTQKTLRGPRGGFLLCKKEYQKQIDQAVFPLIQSGPFMNVIAAKAITFELASQSEFIEYQKQVIINAKIMAEEFKKLGYRIVSDGTDSHLFIIDLRDKKITGDMAEKILASEGILVNKNCIPFDSQPPKITSGIRIGTAAITTRVVKDFEVIGIAKLIDQLIKEH